MRYQNERHLDDALTSVLHILDDDLFAAHIGPHLTCREVDTFAELLRTAGYTDGAAFLVLRHAAADEIDDAHVALQPLFGLPRTPRSQAQPPLNPTEPVAGAPTSQSTTTKEQP